LIGYTRKGFYEDLYDYATCFDNKFRQNNGYQPMTTYERLSFTTPAGLSSANYTIDIICYVQDELRIINGKASSMKA